MTGKPFFDTNVVLYAFTSRASASSDTRAEKAEELLNLGGIVSVQVLNEFADIAVHKLKFTWDAVERGLNAVTELCGRAFPLDAETHNLAIALSKRYGFRIYDSLIVAAAEQAGCETLYSEDLHHGQSIGKVKIVNPFL